MSAAQVDPHDKMRARDVNKVARGEQAPRPAHEYGSISSAPPKPTSPSSAAGKQSYDSFDVKEERRRCYGRYVEYHKCNKEKGKNAAECYKFADYYKSFCPDEWIESWNQEGDLGTFPGQI